MTGRNAAEVEVVEMAEEDRSVPGEGSAKVVRIEAEEVSGALQLILAAVYHHLCPQVTSVEVLVTQYNRQVSSFSTSLTSSILHSYQGSGITHGCVVSRA